MHRLNSMTESTALEGGRGIVQREITRVLRHHCEPLPAPERGRVRLVLRPLRRCVHCAHWRNHPRDLGILSRPRRHHRAVISHHGFAFVAVEADWPDAARIDRYIRHGEALSDGSEPFARFPTWMWRNTEVQAFADWLRDYNKPLPPEKRVSFHGPDIYSLSASIAAVPSYLDRADPQAARIDRRRWLPYATAGGARGLRLWSLER